MLKDAILVLRQENAQLMVEINEMKHDIGLREDQVRAQQHHGLNYVLVLRTSFYAHWFIGVGCTAYRSLR